MEIRKSEAWRIHRHRSQAPGLAIPIKGLSVTAIEIKLSDTIFST
jgi:hypothetical protein